MAEAYDLLVIHLDDDVAVALRDLPAGKARLRDGAGALRVLDVAQSVPLGHKLALHDLPSGTSVRKYGAVIGEATASIVAGAHVHVHNLRSLRARRREELS